MTKINYQALREKAEKATSGVWSLEYGEERFDAGDALIHREVVGYLPICRIEGAHPESGFDEDFQMEQQANAEFIAAASPATVLALLDELEKMQAQSSKWCEAFHKAVSVGARYEERIAELEAREQKNLAEERQRVIDGLCTIGETAWEIEEYMKEWDAKHPHEAATAGIGVKGE
ncbi:ead/Ea22-like family protein [Escherichia coli]|nr:ead/Ea22-like family protein [Shigella boydii]MEB8167992.1 ead/Ea22-like family protein [Escherichia coli]